MPQIRKAAAVGLASGLALFMAAVLTVLIAARPSGSDLKVAPMDPSVAAPAEQLGKAFAMIAARVRPTVVSVVSEKVVKITQPEFQFPFGDNFFQQFFGQQFPSNPQQPQQQQPQQPRQRERHFEGMGSGMILDKSGLVLTNYHVVKDVDDVRVRLADASIFEAEIVSTDPQTDVAVIRMKGRLPENLPAVELGDSDAMEVGDLVMAVGAPFGYAQTVTNGIISAKGRSGVGINSYEDFLQTDAAINPGNSGGPLVNMRAQVIGMNSAIATSVGQFAGVGFAIPINMIKTVLPTLIKGEKVTRGMLGVGIQELTPDLAKEFGLEKPRGALVTQVNAGSAAEKAGIKPRDIIVRFDGKEVSDTTELRNMVAATAPGKKVEVGIVRGGKEETLTATLGKLTPEKMAAGPSEQQGGDMLSKLGLTVQTLTPDMARQLGDEGQQGALIADVAEGTPASLAGLQQGDLITEVGETKVASADDLMEALKKANETKDKYSVLLGIKRKGVSLYVVLHLK